MDMTTYAEPPEGQCTRRQAQAVNREYARSVLVPYLRANSNAQEGMNVREAAKALGMSAQKLSVICSSMPRSLKVVRHCRNSDSIPYVYMSPGLY